MHRNKHVLVQAINPFWDIRVRLPEFTYLVLDLFMDRRLYGFFIIGLLFGNHGFIDLQMSYNSKT
ncbi:hypothetical protein H8S90_21105 [Olivibacter sp. SDN3]|uniref:hypothetical protein n=1 Tax=Olivibacter sp. SDN3 TaxID=2764720 RepID=UPI001651A814|nr:hypothetical protein [Olivibacter sp. SDN3]QNL49210.1 hypothetical protein H8S90_21105 [Olivibacter sp. SDN3]